MNHSTPRLIGSGELQRNAATIIKRVAREDQESFIVTHNKPQAVMMNLRRYRQLKALEELPLIPIKKLHPNIFAGLLRPPVFILRNS